MRGTPTTKFIDLISFRAEGQKGERRGRPRLFITGINLQEGLGFEEGAFDGCDDLKFDNKFEVPVMYSTAIPEPLLRYT
jgi:hypothetical protein